MPVEKLNRLTRGNHQGVVAQTAAIAYVELTDILERVPEDETPLIVLFDGVTDVRNFGAIARSAECAGAHGLVTPLKNSAPVNAEADVYKRQGRWCPMRLPATRFPGRRTCGGAT